ncbi:hypothetical protein STRIP9103_09458 [Streptomyces ipomoeae 91-03]|uniref:Uncharacterized protein n=1 Tax=Streptomyces ipomoeae 91-03 TaxID=698759 RepID=L1KH92_9ACTN|nr:hypothetical protein STRIP9103_09458 [Streptomyces ipomoeae 91-03]
MGWCGISAAYEGPPVRPSPWPGRPEPILRNIAEDRPTSRLPEQARNAPFP